MLACPHLLFTLDADVAVSHDLAGRLVKMLREDDAEQIETSWDGRNEAGQAVAAGIYLCRAECAQRVDILKLVYLR